jgi:hypothetical protein
MILLILWTLPRRLKSDAYTALASFHASAHTQFNLPLASVQCDNGHEFDNAKLHSLAAAHGTHISLSCPYTSQQNSKVEHIIRTVNDIVRLLLFQAIYHLIFGSKLFITPLAFLNASPPKSLARPPYTLIFITHARTTCLFIFLVVFPTSTPHPLCLT